MVAGRAPPQALALTEARGGGVRDAGWLVLLGIALLPARGRDAGAAGHHPPVLRHGDPADAGGGEPRGAGGDHRGVAGGAGGDPAARAGPARSLAATSSWAPPAYVPFFAVRGGVPRAGSRGAAGAAAAGWSTSSSSPVALAVGRAWWWPWPSRWPAAGPVAAGARAPEPTSAPRSSCVRRGPPAGAAAARLAAGGDALLARRCWARRCSSTCGWVVQQRRRHPPAGPGHGGARTSRCRASTASRAR